MDQLKRIAIVSSYDEECGAAFYSSRLKKHFENAGYEVTIKRLPVSLLRIASPVSIRKKGDIEIARIANEVAEFDAVCLQFEPGLYGTTPRSSYRRVKTILSRAKQAIVTVHGFDRHANATSVLMGLYQLITLHPRAAWHEFRHLRISSEVERFWTYVRKSSHVKVLTFCKADQTHLQRHFDIKQIDNYPITYFDQKEVVAIQKSVNRKQFLKQFGLDSGRKYFAVCGFLSRYKGHFTAIKALEYLPEDWSLVILGGEHPHGIEADKDIGGYLKQLLAFSTEEEKSDELDVNFASMNSNKFSNWGLAHNAARQDIRDELFKKSDFKHFLPKTNLSNRIKFLGQVSDEDLPKFYAAIDFIVHPYIKTKSGQSGSGPATMAIEFGAKSLFTNVPVFREMNNYFKNSLHFFNVGNFIELAEALQRHDEFASVLKKNRDEAIKIYNPAGMIAAYCKLLAG